MTWEIPLGHLTALMLAAVRVGAWLAICPPFASRLLPVPVKALLSVAIALPVAPRLVSQVAGLDTPHLLVSLVEQVVVGGALGFLTALLFAAVQSAGALIDVFGGFSMAHAFDQMSMTGTTVFGRFYGLLATTLLLATDGHLLVLRGFGTTFRTLPVDGTLSLDTLSQLLTTGLSTMLVAALQIAGPLLAVLFLTDVALGLLTRAAPALNAFGLGFPLKIFLTLVTAGLGIALLPPAVARLIDASLTMIAKVTP